MGAVIAVAFVWVSFTPPPKATAAAQWEELSQFLEANYHPGDAVILPTSGLPPQLRLPGGAPYYLAGESAALGGNQRLWWLSSLDKPTASPARPGPNEGWQIVGSHWFENQLLSLLVPPEAILALAPRQLDAMLGNQVALRGYGTSLEKRPSSDQPGSLGVTLYWQAKAALDKDYTVFMHLLDGQGRVVSQDDIQPAAGGRPTSGWEPGEVVVDQHTLSLPRGLDLGEYTPIVGLYDASSGQRLNVAAGGNAVPLGPVSLGP